MLCTRPVWWSPRFSLSLSPSLVMSLSHLLLFRFSHFLLITPFLSRYILITPTTCQLLGGQFNISQVTSTNNNFFLQIIIFLQKHLFLFFINALRTSLEQKSEHRMGIVTWQGSHRTDWLTTWGRSWSLTYGHLSHQKTRFQLSNILWWLSSISTNNFHGTKSFIWLKKKTNEIGMPNIHRRHW